jgi:hypothetical protein
MSLDKRLDKLVEAINADQKMVAGISDRQLARALMARARTERDTLPEAGPAERAMAKLLKLPQGTRLQQPKPEQTAGVNFGDEMKRAMVADEVRWINSQQHDAEAVRQHHERLRGLTPRLDGLPS